MSTYYRPTLLAILLFALNGIASDKAPSVESVHHDPAIIHERHGNMVSSTNWSGYALTGSKGSVTDVKGSWVVPSVICSKTNNYASFWVGIDGYNSNTVEQIGTDSDCRNGAPVYYAWFEFYPHPSTTIDTSTLNIKPGDLITAEVTAGAGGEFTVTIVDGTQHFKGITKVKSAQQSSAEWVIEAPYSGGVLPLADFGSVSYTADSATVSGVAQPIGPFSKGNVDEITMVGSKGVIESQPSGLGADNASFSDAFIPGS